MKITKSKIIENKEIIIEHILQIIIFLIPFSIYFSGKLFKNILIPLLIILSIKKIIENGLKISFYEKYLAGFVLIVALSLIFENYKSDKGAIDKIIQILRWGTLPFFMGQLVLKEEHKKALIGGYFFSFLFILNKAFKVISEAILEKTGEKISYLEIFRIKNIKTIEKINNFRLQELFQTVTENAIMLGFIIVFSFCILNDKKIRKYFRAIAGIFFLIASYFLVITQSRGMYLALLLVGIISFSMKKRDNKKKLRNIMIALGFIFLVVLIPTQNTYKNRLLSISKGDQARKVVYTKSLEIFKDNLLTGIGYGNFPQAEASTKVDFHYWGRYKHEHNMGLKMLVETGIFGFIAYFSMMLSIIYNLIKNKEQLINKIALGTISIYMIYENFETIVIYNRPTIYLFFLIAIALNQFYTKKIK